MLKEKSVQQIFCMDVLKHKATKINTKQQEEDTELTLVRGTIYSHSWQAIVWSQLIVCCIVYETRSLWWSDLYPKPVPADLLLSSQQRLRLQQN